MTLADIGRELGISKQGVAKLLQTAAKAPTSHLPLAKIEAASRTLAELAESTRAALAETFHLGATRAHRRIREVHAGEDDAATKTVLETAKLATEGARIVHGWGEQAGGTGGRISIGLVADLRGVRVANQSQIVDVATVAPDSQPVSDSASHPKEQETATNSQLPT